MWQAVRRELARLEWDVEPPLTLDLMADWTQTVSSLVTIRRALGPISTADPLALLATATTGAARTADVKPILAPSLGAVSAALADVGQDMASRPDFDRQRDAATLNHVAYELVHWVRVRTPDEQAKAWLLAGETALDGAIHAPTSRSAVGVGLAAWQDALAAVQPVQNAPIVRRSVALGHLAILRDTHALVDEAAKAGALPGPYADALLGNIRDLARAHQTTLSQIDGRRLGATRVDQAVMLQVGTAVRQLTGRPEPTEPLPRPSRRAAALGSRPGGSGRQPHRRAVGPACCCEDQPTRIGVPDQPPDAPRHRPVGRPNAARTGGAQGRSSRGNPEPRHGSHPWNRRSAPGPSWTAPPSWRSAGPATLASPQRPAIRRTRPRSSGGSTHRVGRSWSPRGGRP